jgi:hypothetical protein
MSALGRLVEHDPRSLNFPFPVTDVPLVTKTWGRYGTILNQGNLGSCTGNAIAGACNCKIIHIPDTVAFHEKDAVHAYSVATQLDGFPGAYPPDDTGSSGLAACKAAKSFGWITSYQHAFDINSALQALMHGPVITGVNWYEGFDNPDASGYVKISGQIRGGHEFVIRGYRALTKLVWADNSWGSSWGYYGRFCFSVDTWAQLLSEQGDVTVPLRA